ncbi:hypothetical protein BYT27DRAFT_7259343 [Phlegmacium glaucopus]|nr:hypothetical protein BYT27DRAFT_7259343 [Phlegmacium glaucopus]
MQDLPEARRMKDEDALDQITTFLIAGHKTRYTRPFLRYSATMFLILIQSRVKKYPMYLPTIQQRTNLDAVIRETLQLYPPVSSTVRAGEKDDWIPLSKPFTERKQIV